MNGIQLTGYRNAYFSYGSGHCHGCPCSNTVGLMPNMGKINNIKLISALDQRYSQQVQHTEDLAEYEKESKEFTKELESIMAELEASSSSLKDYSSNSVTTPFEYGSNDNAVVSVTSDSAAGYDAKDVTLSVSQLAQAQQNQTNAIDSTGTDLTGKTTLKIATGDGTTSTSFDFDIKEGTTNKAALEEMAATVNKADTGVTASIVEKDGKSVLNLTSTKTGEQSAFTASLTGDASAKLNTTITTKAQDAVYKENGKTMTSQTNDIKVANDKVDVTLKGVGDATLSKQTQMADSKTMIASVKDFAEDYNKALSFFEKHSDKSDAVKNLASSFNLTTFSTNELAEIGIDVDSSGALSVDESALASALKNNPDKVKKALSEPYGLADSTHGKVTKIQNNPRDLFPMPESLRHGSKSPVYDRNLNFATTYASGTYLNIFM